MSYAAITQTSPIPQRVAFAVLLSAVCLGAFLRISSIDGVLLQGDEYHSLKLVPKGYLEILSTFDNRGSGIALPLLQRLAADLFGYNLWAVRLPAILGSLALLVFFYPLVARVVGRTGAIIGSLLVASSSSLIYHGHFARSYSLAAFLALVLVCELQRCADGRILAAKNAAVIALLFGLMPLVHLGSSSVAVPASAGLVIVLALNPERRAELRRLVYALIAGGGGAILLYLPARSSFWHFVEAKTTKQYTGNFATLDVTGVLAGSRLGAIAIGVLGLVALLVLFRRRRWQVAPLVLACAGPGLVLLFLRPYGDAYAYSRYALFSLPCVFAAMGSLIAGAFEPKDRENAASAPVSLAAVGLAAALVCTVFAAGPLGLGRISGGPFASSYLSLYRLPAFDIPYPQTPAVYDRLAQTKEPLRIIEAPMLKNRSLHLYRNYYLQHGAEVILGSVGQNDRPLPRGAVLDLLDVDQIESSDADFLVLHRNLSQEVSAYWKWVYAGTSEMDSPIDSTVVALMERHSSNWARDWISPDSAMLAQFEAELGRAIYEDPQVIVWSLHGQSLP